MVLRLFVPKMNIPFSFTILINVFLYIAKIGAQCTLPTLLDGNWWDSRTGTITVTRSSGALSGWTVSAYSSTVTGFTCFQSDSSYWLFKSDNSIVAFSSTYHLYYCVKYTKISDYSYYYYLDSNSEPQISDVRISLREVGATESISIICNPTDGPSTEEFHVLVAENKQADVKQWFPDSVLGVYAYTVTDKSNSVSCGANTVWDACTNRTTMSLNYTQCNTQLFGSTGGELYATKYISSGSTDYVIIINGDSSTSTRFTCLAVSGTNVVSNPGSCAKGQNASLHTGDANSVKISLSAYETCPFSTDTSSSSSTAGIIAGVVVVVLIIIAVVVVVAILYFKPLPCQKGKVADTSEKPLPIAERDTVDMLPLNNDIVARTIYVGSAVEPISPRVAIDMNTADINRNTALPPLPKPSVPVDIHANDPLPSITRQ